MIYNVLWGNTPYLELLRVMSKFQKQGFGSQMLEIMEVKLRGEGYEAYVSSSEKINAGGNEFHIKKGFEPIGTLEMIFGPENFYLKKL